ncbi:hypothetical protein ACLB2K_044468 [Fragaria x ananassa]
MDVGYEEEEDIDYGNEVISASSNVEESIDTIESENVKEKIEEPKIGLVYDSIDELEKYYRSYGKRMGFEVCKRTSSKGDDGKLKYITFTCSRFGKPNSKSIYAFKF